MVVTGDQNYTTVYTYDNNNRLLTEAKTEDGATATTSYTYDANGNTLTVSTPANAENEAVTKAYSYNRFNQQISVLTNDLPTAQYTYNAQGIRTTKTVGTEQTSFLLDGGNVVAEIQGDATTNYLRGVNLISKTVNSAADFYLFNAHGDVVNLTNATGITTKSYDYDAFGNERTPDEADPNPFRYCGEYYDAETGTYYLRARYYAPWLGRFMTEDTCKGSHKDPLSLNLYLYCAGNPVGYFDPSGNSKVTTLNQVSTLFNWGLLPARSIPGIILITNGLAVQNVFHEIAQIHLAKYLYDRGGDPVLECKIAGIGEIDVVSGIEAYEVKPLYRSGVKQIEKYTDGTGFTPGKTFSGYAEISDIPLFGKYRMRITPSTTTAGVVHYSFYEVDDKKQEIAVSSATMYALLRKHLNTIQNRSREEPSYTPVPVPVLIPVLPSPVTSSVPQSGFSSLPSASSLAGSVSFSSTTISVVTCIV